MSIYWIDF